MAEYIDREAALTDICDDMCGLKYTGVCENCRVVALIAATPAADVAPVVRAEWVNPHWRNSDYCYDCSNCGGEAMHRIYRWRDEKIYPICPNCGAKMDGGADNG